MEKRDYTNYMNYDILQPNEVINKTVEGLQTKGYETFVVQTAVEALAQIKDLIPENASVMNGSSVTLEQVGYVDYLKSGLHKWNNLHESVLVEKDPAKQSVLRKHATVSDYYLGSVHALVQNGEFIIASNTGSQLPSVAFNSANLIFVVSTKKIVPTLDEAMKRLTEYVVPLEDNHMKEKYGMGTALNKILIFKGESAFMGRKVKFILVNELLGF